MKMKTRHRKGFFGGLILQVEDYRALPSRGRVKFFRDAKTEDLNGDLLNEIIDKNNWSYRSGFLGKLILQKVEIDLQGHPWPSWRITGWRDATLNDLTTEKLKKIKELKRTHLSG